MSQLDIHLQTCTWQALVKTLITYDDDDDDDCLQCSQTEADYQVTHKVLQVYLYTECSQCRRLDC